MKNIFLIALILGIFSGAVKARFGFGLFQQNTPTVSSFGTRNATVDQLLARVVVRQPGRIAQVVTNTYAFTQSANPPLQITAITVTEQRRGRFSTVAISQGGVGTPSVTLQFTSQRGAGINSLVEIYGAPTPVTTTVAPAAAAAPPVG